MPQITSASPLELQRAGEMLKEVTPGVDMDTSQAVLTHLLHVGEVKLGLPGMTLARGAVVHTLTPGAPAPVTLSCGPIALVTAPGAGGMPGTATAFYGWVLALLGILVGLVTAARVLTRRV
jgi:hypothetical protein